MSPGGGQGPGTSSPVQAVGPGPVHFVGIGGAGMSGIARILLARGVPVSGSDLKYSLALAGLRALGARIDVGHAADQVPETGTVVVSSAIRATNVEVAEARRRGLPVLPRAAVLAAVMRGRRGVAVAGTHGKTTTTSMLTVALQHCGLDPSFAIGGDLNESGSNAHHGSGDIFVAEADESDGSFLLLTPSAAVVTNVELDHVDHYPDPAAVEAAFAAFVARVDGAGFLVACADDAGARRLAQAAGARLSVRSYGESDDADLRVERMELFAGGSAYDAVWEGRRLGRVQLSVPGRHNGLNAAGALAAGLCLGLPFRPLADGLAGFRGARRRFEAKGSAGGVRVYDDYAHHPTEIAAVLLAARDVAGRGRVVVAFQPHRYTRTAAFATELGAALGLADSVVVMEVYAAGEDPVPGVTGATVAAAVPLSGDAVDFEPSWSAVAGRVAGRVRPGDVVLTLGAGDVTMLGGEVLVELGSGGGRRA